MFLDSWLVNSSSLMYPVTLHVCLTLSCAYKHTWHNIKSLMYVCNEAEGYDFLGLVCLLVSFSDKFRCFNSIGDHQRLNAPVCNSV